MRVPEGDRPFLLDTMPSLPISLGQRLLVSSDLSLGVPAQASAQLLEQLRAPVANVMHSLDRSFHAR